MYKKWEYEPLSECILPTEVMTAFDSATRNFQDLVFRPILYYGKEICETTNYVIICKQHTNSEPPEDSLVLVTINSSPKVGIDGKLNYEIVDISHIA